MIHVRDWEIREVGTSNPPQSPPPFPPPSLITLHDHLPLSVFIKSWQSRSTTMQFNEVRRMLG